MAEGGQFPWKRQTIRLGAGPPGDYSTIRSPLPEPKGGQEWQKGVDGEWKLVEKKSKETEQKDPKSSEDPALVEDKEDMDTNSKKDETKKEPVENVDYLIHTVLPSDTLAGLCLRYKVSATKLRQMNKFSGSNLLLAPSNLVVPLKKDCDSSVIQVQDKTKPEYKLQTFLQSCPHLRLSERRAYLEMNHWDLDAAIAQAQADDVWEEQQSPVKKWTQAGPRRVLLNVHTATTTTTTTKTALAKHKGVSKSFDNELTEPLLEKKKKTESTTSILELARRNS